MKNLVKIKPECTAMKVSRESQSARELLKIAVPESKILDYGCGFGRNIRYLKNNGIKKIDGCETPAQLDNIDKSKFQDVILKTADYYKENNKKYDYILCCHVLNVVDDSIKKQILDDMYTLLNKGGQAVIQVRTEADVASAKSKEKCGDGWIIKKGKEFTYQEGITKKKMVELLAAAGLKIVNHKFTKSIHMLVVEK